MHKERKDKHFIHKPTYPGGREGLKAFVKKNLRYPKKALQEKIEGTVSLKYTIDNKGIVIDTHVVSGLGHGCDEEAIRLVKLLKFQVPKAPKKQRILFHKDLHVHFRLPKTKVVKGAKAQYQYTTPTREESPSEPPKKSGSYHYTVTISKK